jgi:hypothetical protein
MSNISDLVAVATFRSTADALIAKGLLDEAGIESMVRSDNAGGMYPALAGADLLVRAEDLDRAHDALTGIEDDDHEPRSHGDPEV